MRYGTIAIVGRTNVGKSTFLNAVLGTPLAIVSHQPQTTRDTLLGVYHSDDAQAAFVDTPGLHRPKNELGRRMNAEAIDSLRGADAALVFTEAPTAATRKARSQPSAVEPGDRDLIGRLPAGLPCVLVVNKIDRLRDKAALLPLLQELGALHSFAACVPASALKRDGVDRVLQEVLALLPEGAHEYEPEALTDRPLSFFAREYVREQVLSGFGKEVPHAVAVTLDAFEERDTGAHIHATIHVEKVGQRIILVGRGGEKLRQVGQSARQRLAELMGRPVHLRLFVRVTDRWRNAPRRLSELGYGRS